MGAGGVILSVAKDLCQKRARGTEILPQAQNDGGRTERRAQQASHPQLEAGPRVFDKCAYPNSAITPADRARFIAAIMGDFPWPMTSEKR